MICPSRSPYAAPVVLDQKKNGTWRMCIDYKRLNQQTAENSGPMGNTNNILRLIPIGYWYSVIDLESGYWQIELHKDSIAKSAFVTEENHWEFLVMPFGLRNAGKTFCALMNKLFEPYIDKFVKVFMDDTLIYSKDMETHFEHIRMVLEKFKEANLTINVDKSEFARREVAFLGHIITPKGIKRSPEKVEAILNWPLPQNIKDIQRFNGICQWYSSFIPNFAHKAEPLYSLLRKGTPWHWGPKQQEAFDRLKTDMCDKVMLQGVDYTKPIIVKCDASEIGLGAALVQVIDGKERPITFISKTLKKYERNAHIYEKEIYAIIWAVQEFNQYLEGHAFTVHTDNRAVNYLHSMKNKKNKLMRWANEIMSWNVTIVLKPGRENVEADALSRAPIPEKDTDPTLYDEADDIVYTPIACMCYDTPTWEKIKSEQMKDEDLLKIIKLLAQPHNSSAGSYDGYKIENGVLKKEIIFERKMHELVRGKRTQEFEEGEHEENRSDPHVNVKTVQNLIMHAGQDRSQTHTGDKIPVEKTTKTPIERRIKLVPVIPKSLIIEIMNIFHDAPEAAHLGMRKTKQKIKDRCFWKNMNKDIEKYVHACHVCQVTKPINLQPSGLLGCVNPPTAIFETIHIDFMGPFPASSTNLNKYLFVVIDQLSKWVELIPMRAATSKKVAETLENQVFCRFGTPKFILSDNGSQFISKTIKQLCKQWRVHHYFTSPYHPQPNLSERVNRNLKSMIQAYVQENHRKWDVNLQKFAFALRTSVNETTKVTPSLLNLGRQLPMPFDRNLQMDRNENHEEIIQELSDLPEKLKEIISWVRENIVKSHALNKQNYDKKHREVKYEVGELVLIKDTTLSEKDTGVMKKFANRWMGPVMISGKVTDLTYEITNIDTKKLIGKRHVADLKPYFQREQEQRVIDKNVNQVKKFQTVKRCLRNTPRVNYRTLSGYRQNRRSVDLNQ